MFLVSILSNTAEISCSPGTRGVIGLAVARALLQLFPDQVDNTHRAAHTSRGGDEVSFLIYFGEIQEYSWLDEVAISSRNSEVIHAGAEMPTGSPLFVPVSQLLTGLLSY